MRKHKTYDCMDYLGEYNLPGISADCEAAVYNVSHIILL